ncbi:programmed cell death protein 2 isoform X2 [Passer montanus]|uniref:programmed cell death protein 2 isoform X2 n=1 Tax=Passer montanus TaxID=9160 RepID=UPI00195F3DC1|nr:programmed cell death protein 2 isoform X2 [Passer montanus]
MAPGVELGFAAAAEGPGGAWRLHSTYFPSKVGGRPAWLGEAGLPGPAALRCGQCQQPRAFLLQLYAPLPGRPDAFHRSLFVFACRSPACYRLAGPSGPFRVFRSQLPRRNDTYPERCCGRCRRAAYCGPEHQALDWRRGHRRSCGQHAAGEYEILIEPEEPEFPADSTDDEQGAEDTSKDAKEQEELGAAGPADEAFQSLDEETLEAMAKHETEEEKIFQMFKKQVAAEPEQIIRYCRGEGPLWVSGENRPEEKDIPNCVCGAKRIFEFQIMPQLLNHLQVDSLGESIDWGTLVVYTCADSCGGGTEYLEEFIWKQDYSMGSTL